MEFVSLNMADIDPPAAKVWSFDAQQGYWWIDETGELNIALKHEQRNVLLGKFGWADLGLSFAFDAPPAGRARNYTVKSREARIVYTSSLANQRFLPFAGIVAVIVGDDGVVRGSFRLWTAPLTEAPLFSFLPQRPGNVVCFGTFEAVKDAARGKAIRSFCESGGYSRPPRAKAPASQPASPTTSSRQNIMS
jgi:hypothetical protein